MVEDDGHDDRIWLWAAVAFLGFMLLRDRRILQRLADVEVPTGILGFTLCLLIRRQRATDRALVKFNQATAELGEFLGNRMKESDERAREVLELNRSVKRLTTWLVVLTVVLGAIGVAAIVTTIVVAT